MTLFILESSMMTHQSKSLQVLIQSHPCPVVIGCSCVDYDTTDVNCLSVAYDVIPQLARFYPHLRRLYIEQWNEPSIDIAQFSVLTELEELSLEGERFVLQKKTE